MSKIKQELLKHSVKDLEEVVKYKRDEEKYNRDSLFKKLNPTKKKLEKLYQECDNKTFHAKISINVSYNIDYAGDKIIVGDYDVNDNFYGSLERNTNTKKVIKTYQERYNSILNEVKEFAKANKISFDECMNYIEEV
jgi:hypothetical protein